MQDDTQTSDKPQRLMSLDTLRGMDMLCIMGTSLLVISLCKLCGWGEWCWLAKQMRHVKWHGFTQHDTIFPLFMFLAGVSWPFSYAGQIARGRSTLRILAKIAYRVVALCILGVFGQAFFSGNWGHMRWLSVLGQIGFCWAAAALIYMFVKSWKVQLAIVIGILVGHWALLYFVSAPDAAQILNSTDPGTMKVVASYAKFGTDNFSFTGNLAGWVDRMFAPGSLCERVFDPEGLLGKLSGTAVCMLGALSGMLLRKTEISGNRKTVMLLVAGAICLGACFAWQPWCPINKKLWTSTFILAAGAYSFFALAVFYWIIDVKGFRRWTFFFRVIGMNSITIYMMMRFVNFKSISEYFLCGLASLGNADGRMVVIYAGQIAIEWIVLWYLYRNRTFLKV